MVVRATKANRGTCTAAWRPGAFSARAYPDVSRTGVGTRLARNPLLRFRLKTIETDFVVARIVI